MPTFIQYFIYIYIKKKNMYNWTDQCCKFSMPESIGECSLHFWQSNQYILYDYIPYLRLDGDIAIISKHGDLKRSTLYQLS